MHLPRYSANNHPFFNCGNFNCPLCAKAYSQLKIKPYLKKKEFSTEAVAPFIGRFNYPNLNVGILAPPTEEKDSWLYDAPRFWAQNNLQIPDIVNYRSSLINSRTSFHVKKREKFLDISQQVSLASNPVDVSLSLKKEPFFRVSYDSVSAPHGPVGLVEKAKLTENPKIHTKVQKVHYANDMKAQEAILYLYKNKFDENFLSRILSVGSIGLETNRKIVPTRWSLTATHDTLGKHLTNEIKDYPVIDYSAYFGGYLGNYYLILCFPEVWNYELFEMHVDNPHKYTTDYEPYSGRKDYATNTAGGYYTVRLAILEQLGKLRKQGSILALRFITGDYTLPLGVWVTLEATRNAMNSQGIEFSSRELMLEYAKKIAKRKFDVDLSNILSKSVLLKTMIQQSKLATFL